MAQKQPKEPSGEEAYRLPNQICATCGKPTSSRRKSYSSGYGDWHINCRRNEQGRLIVRFGEADEQVL